jgi:hypothetical protein
LQSRERPPKVGATPVFRSADRKRGPEPLEKRGQSGKRDPAQERNEEHRGGREAGDEQTGECGRQRRAPIEGRPQAPKAAAKRADETRTRAMTRNGEGFFLDRLRWTRSGSLAPVRVRESGGRNPSANPTRRLELETMSAEPGIESKASDGPPPGHDGPPGSFRAAVIETGP